MDKAQTPINSECHTPPSEPFRIYFYLSQLSHSDLLRRGCDVILLKLKFVAVLHIRCGMLGICEDSCSSCRFLSFPPSRAYERQDECRSGSVCNVSVGEWIQLHTVLNLLIMIIVFWNVTSCSLVDRYQQSRMNLLPPCSG
jgi:hypothetical protein